MTALFKGGSYGRADGGVVFGKEDAHEGQGYAPEWAFRMLSRQAFAVLSRPADRHSNCERFLFGLPSRLRGTVTRGVPGHARHRRPATPRVLAQAPASLALDQFRHLA